MPQIGYLSASLRAATHSHAPLGGPRTHMLGMIHAFELAGYEVKPFIVGDMFTRRFASVAKPQSQVKNPLRGYGADIFRIVTNPFIGYWAQHKLGHDLSFVYERLAPLQSLGQYFQRRGVPWILETNAIIHYEATVEYKTLTLKNMAKRREINAYHQADIILTSTEQLKQLVVDVAQVSPDKIFNLPNGVNTEIFKPPADVVPNAARFTVGFVGSMFGWQGLQVLLQAVNALKQEGVLIHLILVGDGPVYPELQAYVATHQLQDQVEFVGHIPLDDVPSQIARFDVGFAGLEKLKMGVMYHSPLKIYEYMAMGKPVISTASEDAQAVITEGHTGFLFEESNLASLKAAIQRAHTAHIELPKMGEVARNLIVANHSWLQRTHLLLAFLQERGILKQ